MQVIHTKFGKLMVEQSWAESTTMSHVARLAGGGYAHMSGAPIKAREDLSKAITDPEELKKAFEWFENRNNLEVGAKRSFKVNALGEWTYDNGDPLEHLGDILNNTVPGLTQDAMIKWMMARDEEKKAVEEGRQTLLGKATSKVLTKKRGESEGE
jgi:hypothetical protein